MRLPRVFKRKLARFWIAAFAVYDWWYARRRAEARRTELAKIEAELERRGIDPAKVKKEWSAVP
jgi:hypothetical protein